CADPEAWGKVCTVSINPCATVNGGANSLIAAGNSHFTMYPNPNRGDQLFVNLTGVDADIALANVDIFDLTGKRVLTRVLALQDGRLNTNVELAGLSGGLYLVNVSAGDESYTERLVIQP
ncbi:MAG: T9SS type A sorting domain-containing protein, partial [Flavobacteriales bacterium]